MMNIIPHKIRPFLSNTHYLVKTKYNHLIHLYANLGNMKICLRSVEETNIRSSENDHKECPGKQPSTHPLGSLLRRYRKPPKNTPDPTIPTYLLSFGTWSPRDQQTHKNQGHLSGEVQLPRQLSVPIREGENPSWGWGSCFSRYFRVLCWCAVLFFLFVARKTLWYFGLFLLRSLPMVGGASCCFSS